MQNIEEWIKNTIAGQKNTSALFLVGERGSGKTLFATALGERVSSVIFPRPRKSYPFNSHLIGPALVVFDEWSGEFEEIKPLVSGKLAYRSAIGEGDTVVENPSNYLFLLSKPPVEPTDQRRMIVTNPAIAAIALLNVVTDE